MSDGIAVANAEATVWIAEVTDKGNALLAKLAAGNTLEITKAVSGSGAVDTTLLKQQTTVATPQQTVTIQPVAYPGEKKCKLPITIRNAGLATSYTCTNIGVFANDPDEGEILFFLAAADGPGTSIVSETLQPGYSADYDFYVSYGNADGVNVTVDPSNAVTQGAMENYVATEMAKLIPDNEKHVAYAQRAGKADKTQSELTIRINGGREEGTNAWTFDGSTDRTINITPAKIGAAPAIESTEYPGCYYRTVNGETEWLNPPMVSGVSYRTTERYNGMPVYAVLMQSGSLKGKGEELFALLAGSTILDVQGTLSDGSTLPHITPDYSVYMTTAGNTVTVALYAGTFKTDVTASVLIRYIK